MKVNETEKTIWQTLPLPVCRIAGGDLGDGN